MAVVQMRPEGQTHEGLRQLAADDLDSARSCLTRAMHRFAVSGDADLNPGLALAVDAITDAQAKLTGEAA